MKAQTCCCHVCKTSLNQYKREFLPCTQCNKIVCRPCFGTKWKGPTWEESIAARDKWLCPSCSGTCPCPRCKKKPKLGFSPQMEEDTFKISYKSHVDLDRVRQAFEDSWDSQDGFISEVKSESDCEKNDGDKSPLCTESPDGWNSMEKLKPRVHRFVLQQLQDLAERERRVDENLDKMERLFMLIKREKEDIIAERQKLESAIAELDVE
mmetsp:Transcript_18939/g.26475  ORF Transcript_18939/g.26475 Transcript_18939/m.26475 type:complete len:209 (+) Transcript_18939:82-708(+)